MKYFSCYQLSANLFLVYCHCKCNCFRASTFFFNQSYVEMVKDKRSEVPALVGFYEAMEKTNIEKIIDEILAGLSEDSEDNEDFGVDSGADDAEERPWRPSHVNFGKSTMKKGHVEAMKGTYFNDVSIVRIGGENIVSLPKKNEVVVFRSFMKGGLRFSLHKMLVEVLKKFEIFLHQLTPEALIKVGIFIWAIKSQGLEPDVDWFCNIHELSYQTKATGKEQYHNNFGCYTFVYRSDIWYLVPTFRKKWSGSWMKQCFYMKNDLNERNGVKDVIQWSYRSSFGLKRPTILNSERSQACLATFNAMCNYINTRDLVQERTTFKVWPLAAEWEMSKDAKANANANKRSLVHLKYSYRYRNQFGEPDDD
jgi:hypothetical protein